MLKSNILTQVEQIYRDGGNISKFLKSTDCDSLESILISYEFQAGSYVDGYKKNPDVRHKYSQAIIDELKNLGSFNSILEAGVGEATTFKFVMNSDMLSYDDYYSFDISWSRLNVAKDFLKDAPKQNNQYSFVAELASIPLCNDAIDIVYTSHSIEPNKGHEKEILQELYRITKNYLVLFEPDYDFASDEGKARMDEHSYIQNLSGIAQELGYDVIKRELLPFIINPLNPTSVIVIKKSDVRTRSKKNIFQCPVSKSELINRDEIFFAPEPRLMYPVIQGIPCLLDSHAILGCKYKG